MQTQQASGQRMWTAQYHTLPFQASEVLKVINRTEESTISGNMSNSDRWRDHRRGLKPYIQRMASKERSPLGATSGDWPAATVSREYSRNTVHRKCPYSISTPPNTGGRCPYANLGHAQCLQLSPFGLSLCQAHSCLGSNTSHFTSFISTITFLYFFLF